MFHKVWKRLKVARKLRLGPASLVFYFERTVAVRRARIERRTDRLAPPDLTQATRGAAEADRVLADSAPAQSAEKRGRELALIIGTGPGLGVALAECLAAEGFELALAARNAPRLESLASHLRAGAGAAVAVYACDATSELSVDALFRQIIGHQGIPGLVVYAIQEFGPGRTVEVEVPAFESAWRHNCFGAFLVARAAARAMTTIGRGTIILIGSTSSLVGRESHLNLAVGKFGQRALAQVLSKEMWAQGVHVAHLVIDADIREGDPADYPQSDPSDISAAILFLHRQPRSAWTSELDIRPWNERFWEHC